MDVDNPSDVWSSLSFQYTENGGKNWFFWSGRWIPVDKIALPCFTDGHCHDGCIFCDLRSEPYE